MASFSSIFRLSSFIGTDDRRHTADDTIIHTTHTQHTTYNTQHTTHNTHNTHDAHTTDRSYSRPRSCTDNIYSTRQHLHHTLERPGIIRRPWTNQNPKTSPAFHLHQPETDQRYQDLERENQINKSCQLFHSCMWYHRKKKKILSKSRSNPYTLLLPEPPPFRF